MRIVFPALLVMSLLILNASAYFNVTYLNATVTLNSNGSAHVDEALNLFISNSSIAQYQQDRQAINFTLSKWQSALQTTLLVEHILNPKSSVYDFTFLPGPINYALKNASAQLTLSYDVSNVTTISNIAPRKFLYTFNDSVFNFVHTASGQSLSQIMRLNIRVPKGAEIVAISPAPDFPPPGFVANYTGYTQFSWYSAESLSGLAFSYVTTQSLGQEVSTFFTRIYNGYGALVLLSIIIIIVAIVAYLYLKVSNTKV
ncbi:MAG: hypothetical protein KGH49_02975 [Candidatus Micrarchaeota archaeon]|nr:hypothetical protein [Candidatus Micrarchaeota archaeon]